MNFDLENKNDYLKRKFFDEFMNEYKKYTFGSMLKCDFECHIFSLKEIK